VTDGLAGGAPRTAPGAWLRAGAGGLPARVRVVEVGPRDGLQNEPEAVPTDEKVRLVEALAAAGLREIEVTSFVSPRAVPQLADAEAVFAALSRRDGVTYAALVPNARGLQRALGTAAAQIALFTGATDAFTRHNINRSVEESLADFAPLAAAARAAGRRVRGYVSVAFGCPYEGIVRPERAQLVARRLFDLGVDEVSLGDTIGVATPNQVPDVAGPLLAEYGAPRIALHFHDTRGTALANALAALQSGATVLDAAAGGLGGCPYAPGAAGNLATEDLLYLLHGVGIRTGVDLDAVAAASRALAAATGRRPRSRYLEATGTSSTSSPDVLKKE
jgi:isopropylmalate/homocitrate/citramalate synthase